MKKLFIFFGILIATVLNTNALENPTANQAIIKITDQLLLSPKEILSHINGYGFAVSPDGKKAASIDRNKIKIFNENNNFQEPVIIQNSHFVKLFTFSHDSTAFIITLRDLKRPHLYDFYPQVFDATTGELKFTLKTDNLSGWFVEASQVRWFTLPDDEHITTYTKNCLYLWDAKTGKLLKSNKTFNNLIDDNNWGTTSKYLIDIEDAKEQDITVMMHIVDTLTLQKINSLQVPKDKTLGLNRDASRLMIVGRGAPARLATDPIEELARAEDQPATLELLDTANKKPLVSEAGRRISHVTFNPDGSKMAAVIDHALRIFDSKTGNLLQTIFLDFRSDPFKLAFSPDGKFITITNYPYMLNLYNVDTGRLLYTYYSGDSYPFEYFSSDSKNLFIRQDQTLYKVDISSLEFYPQRDLESAELIVIYFRNLKLSTTKKNFLIKINDLAQQKPGAKITPEDLDAEFLKTAHELPYEVQNALINVYNVDKTIFGRPTYNQPEPAPLTQQETQADIAQSAAYKPLQKPFKSIKRTK